MNMQFLTHPSYCNLIMKQIGINLPESAARAMIESIYNFVLEGASRKDERYNWRDIHDRPLIGSLLYLSTASTPEILFPIGVLRRLVPNPFIVDWNAARRVLCYIVRTISSGTMIEIVLSLSKTRKMDISALPACSDSDLAGGIQVRKPSSGYSAILYGCLVTKPLFN